MDFLTRQFIAAIKLIRDELKEIKNTLSTLHQDFRNQSAATRDASETAKGNKIPDYIISGLPHGVEVRKAASDKHDDEKNQGKLLRVQRITILIVALYTGFAALQWIEMMKVTEATEISAQAARDSADISTEALHSAERAFISSSYNQGQDGKFWRITIRWDNTGVTPTQDMSTHVSFGKIRNTPLPIGFNFRDVWKGYARFFPTRITVPAKGQGDGGEVRIPLALVTKQFPFYYYIWGWAKYRDVFPKTPEHITRFCSVFTSNPVAENTVDIHAASMDDACANYNCTDDQCKK
jgi:hypothetical protein